MFNRFQLQLFCSIGFSYLVWWDRNRVSEKGRGEVTEVQKNLAQELTWFMLIFVITGTLGEEVEVEEHSGTLSLSWMKLKITATTFIRTAQNFRRSLADSPYPGSLHSARCRSTPSSTVTFSRFNNLKAQSLKIPVGILLLWPVPDSRILASMCDIQHCKQYLGSFCSTFEINHVHCARGERIVFWWPNTNTNIIRFPKNDRIQIRILFG